MPRVPFVGRLFLREYLALIFSFLLIGLEALVRVITLALPAPIIQWFYNRSRTLYNSLSSPQGKRNRHKKKNAVARIREASDFVDICALFGYEADEHVVQTGDGYLLGLHRLSRKRGEEGRRVNSGEGSLLKPVVYLHHGLLMNSEVWVCLTEKERSLPFALLEKGYDVWLGNNRGNKYSKKSTIHSPTTTAFWDFSMDQFAFHDIPDSIGYILSTTRQVSLSFVGFSQGTAQAFAALAIHPDLNERVDVFIALAPAMAPSGLSNGFVDALVKASPEVIFLAFGRRSILSSANMWQAILYPPIFVWIIDYSLKFLFNWRGNNITDHQKHAAYPHLYSFTSTKSVVHWFQIIRNKSFQMYDDDVQTPLSLGGSGKYYKVARFPTKNIKTPIVLVYGGSDSLVDIDVMLKQLPSHTIANKISHFEHLDFLWADEVDKLVFPHVFDALDSFANPNNAKGRALGFRPTRFGVLTPGLPTYSEDERFGGIAATAAGTSGSEGQRDLPGLRKNYKSRFTEENLGRDNPISALESVLDGSASPTPSNPAARRRARLQDPKSTLASASAEENDSPNVASGAPLSAGSWLSYNTADAPLSSAEEERDRRGSTAGQHSLDRLRSGKPAFEGGGISLGAGKAVGGVSKVDDVVAEPFEDGKKGDGRKRIIKRRKVT